MKSVRPWGYFKTYISTRKFTVKDLTILPGQALSLQYHRKRTEVWAWIDGPAPRVTIGLNTFFMEPGKQYVISPGTKHRIENLNGLSPCTVLELSYGKFDEEDIVRINDFYGRA